MNRFIFYVACDTADLTSTELAVVQDNIAHFVDRLLDDPIVGEKSTVCVIEFGRSTEVLMHAAPVVDVTSVPILQGTSGPADFAALFRILRFLVPRDVRATRRTATVQDLAVVIVTKAHPAPTAWESERSKLDEALERVGVNNGVPLVAVGLAEADENVLSELGRWNMRKLFFKLDDGADLGDVAREIRGLLRSEPILAESPVFLPKDFSAVNSFVTEDL